MLGGSLSAAVVSTEVIVTAGLAVVAGAIAMGLGGYLAARTDAEHCAAEENRKNYEIDHLPEEEIEEVETILREYGLEGKVLQNVVNAVAADRRRWVDFMMRFELGLERPDPKRAPISAATIGGSYIIGGLMPLIPYMLVHNITTALQISVAATGFALLCFGAIKGQLTGVNKIKSALQTLLVGGLAWQPIGWRICLGSSMAPAPSPLAGGRPRPLPSRAANRMRNRPVDGWRRAAWSLATVLCPSQRSSCRRGVHAPCSARFDAAAASRLCLPHHSRREVALGLEIVESFR